MLLRKKILYSFIGAAALPIAIIGVIAFSDIGDLQRTAALEHVQVIADVKGSAVRNTLDFFLVKTRLLAGDPRLGNLAEQASIARDAGSARELQAMLREMIASSTAVVSLAVRDTGGNALAATDDNVYPVPSVAPRALTPDIRYLGTVFNAVGRPVVRLATPIISNGREVGLLELSMDFTGIVNNVTDRTGLGDSGDAVLAEKLDGGGAVSLTPLREDAGAMFIRTIPESDTASPVILTLQGKDGFATDRGLSEGGTAVIAATAYIPGYEWVLAVVIDKDEVYLGLTDLYNLLFFTGMLLLLLVIFLASFMSLIITGPLSRLGQISNELAAGDHSVRSDVTSKDEIGVLAANFNHMAAKLEEEHGNLETTVSERTKELQTTLALDEAILGSIADGLIVLDRAGIVREANDTAVEMLGMTKKGLIGKSIAAIRIEHEDGTSVVKRPFDLVMETKKKVVGTYCYFHERNGKFPASLSISPIVQAGKIVGAVEVFRDVTVEKAVERSKTEFVSIASHQLRGPLTSMKWYAEMLLAGEGGKTTPAQREYLRDMLTSGKIMTDLVSALLNVSRIETGTLAVQPVLTDLPKLVEDIGQELKLDIHRKNLRVSVNVEAGLPKVKVDPKLIRIAFQNLFTNAVKYTPEKGKVTASLRKAEKGDRIAGHLIARDSILASVADTGYGIPKAQHANIFKKFFRSPNIRDKAPDGTGLGLYITKAIVENAGGEIWFRSAENKGTEFFFSIPMGGMKRSKGTTELVPESI